MLMLPCPNVVLFLCLLPFLLHAFPATVDLLFAISYSVCGKLPGCLGLYFALFPFSQSISFSSISQWGRHIELDGKSSVQKERASLHYSDRISGTVEFQLGGGRAQLIKSLGGRMWISVIWEMLPCDCCAASPDLLLSVERAGLLLLPDVLAGSTASHFCLHLYFLSTTQSETHILTLREPYRHVWCSLSRSGRDGDVLHAVLWKFLLEWPEENNL